MGWHAKNMTDCKAYREEEYLILSGVQSFAFCRRQWALRHIEQQYEENLRTIEGHLMHERVHDGYVSEKRGEVIIARGVAVSSASLGVSGVCDIVEFRRLDKAAENSGFPLPGREGGYSAYPVEYKRGSPKETDMDLLQLTAQALCLEEMLACTIPEGAIFYGETRRRLRVSIDDTLRQRVMDSFEEMHRLFERRYTPRVKPSKACNACSLKEVCLPKLMRTCSVDTYLRSAWNEEVSP